MKAIVVTDNRRFDLVSVIPSHRRNAEVELFALPGGKTVTKEELLKWADEHKHVVRFVQG